MSAHRVFSRDTRDLENLPTKSTAEKLSITTVGYLYSSQ